MQTLTPCRCEYNGWGWGEKGGCMQRPGSVRFGEERVRQRMWGDWDIVWALSGQKGNQLLSINPSQLPVFKCLCTRRVCMIAWVPRHECESLSVGAAWGSQPSSYQYTNEQEREPGSHPQHQIQNQMLGSGRARSFLPASAGALMSLKVSLSPFFVVSQVFIMSETTSHLPSVHKICWNLCKWRLLFWRCWGWGTNWKRGCHGEY